MTKKEPTQTNPDTGELIAALQDAQRQIISLENKLDEYKWLEESLRKRTKDLNERVKELECLYAVGNSLPAAHNLAELLLGVCESLPKGFQFPPSTWVSLEVFGQKIASRGFKSSAHRISRDILVRKEPVGKIEVCVKPRLDRYHKTAILPQENRLVEMVAALIGKMLENKVAA
ncbi:MAG: hypothetical protein ACYC2I_12625 [Elusimicrobiales bacterium]